MIWPWNKHFSVHSNLACIQTGFCVRNVVPYLHCDLRAQISANKLLNKSWKVSDLPQKKSVCMSN